MKNTVLLIVGLLLGGLMTVAGFDKFFKFLPMDMPEQAMNVVKGFQDSGWLWKAIGLNEIIGGLLLMIPLTRAFGALVILPMTTGILMFNYTLSPDFIPVGVAVVALNLIIIFLSREKYSSMFS